MYSACWSNLLRVPGTLVVFSGSGLGVLFIWALQMYIKDILNIEDVLIKPVFPKEHMISIIVKKSNDARSWLAIQAIAERKPERKNEVWMTFKLMPLTY